MDTVVIYKANPDSVQQVLGHLRKEGFNPVVFENSNPIYDYWPLRHTHRIEILVPREEAAGAASILCKWEQANESEVEKLTSSLTTPFLYATIITAVLGLVFAFVGVLSNVAWLLVLVWIVLFALVANIHRL